MKARSLLLALAALLLLWALAARLVNLPLLPDPWTVALTLVSETLYGGLPLHFLASLWRVTAGTLLSILLAAPAGLALGQYRRVNQFFPPSSISCIPFPRWFLFPLFFCFSASATWPKSSSFFSFCFSRCWCWCATRPHPCALN